MPISDIQARVLKEIAANRSPDSYLAGATVLHRGEKTPRFSQDLDFFHDIEEKVSQSAEKDAATLRSAGFGFMWLLRMPTFHRGIVTVDDRQLKIEWAQDSAFRFFPVQDDARFGYRLHDADAAVNKCLALAGRNEVRDFVDILHLHATCLSLGALTWAACGKDPGFTPELLLDQASRHTACSQADLNRLQLREPLDVNALKREWFAALEDAQKTITVLPPDELGCLYLGLDGNPITPDPGSDNFSRLTRHRGSVRGAWPRIVQ